MMADEDKKPDVKPDANSDQITIRFVKPTFMPEEHIVRTHLQSPKLV
jgi:hypothetical protein